MVFKDFHHNILSLVLQLLTFLYGRQNIVFCVLFFPLDISFEEPRLTSWYGELPYTYSRITMQANPDVCVSIATGFIGAKIEKFNNSMNLTKCHMWLK